MPIVEEIVEEILAMGFKSSQEAKDMVIALHGSLNKSVLADVFIKLEEYYAKN